MSLWGRLISCLWEPTQPNPSHIAAVKYGLKNKTAAEEPLDLLIRNKETEHKYNVKVIFIKDFIIAPETSSWFLLSASPSCLLFTSWWPLRRYANMFWETHLSVYCSVVLFSVLKFSSVLLFCSVIQQSAKIVLHVDSSAAKRKMMTS